VSTHYELRPGIAALIHVRELPGEEVHACVYLSEENGVTNIGWLPLEVRAAINRHFATVFHLPHEEWQGYGISPRARYLYNLEPWIITVD